MEKSATTLFVFLRGSAPTLLHVVALLPVLGELRGHADTYGCMSVKWACMHLLQRQYFCHLQAKTRAFARE